MSRKVVLDTNCLVQIISAHSPYRPAWQAFREGRYILCVSNDILSEYSEILERVANAAVSHNILMLSLEVRILKSLTLIFILA